MEPIDTRALPENAYLIQVGSGRYRVIWNLGDDLGWAWYDAGEDQLKNVLGDEWQDQIAEVLPNWESFRAKYGNYYWGNLAEVDLNADTPWEDLRNKVIDQYGPVAGIDDPEVRRTILQGFLESWSANEFISHYKQTDYYNSLSDTQRSWSTLSTAERQVKVQEQVNNLLGVYRRYWGYDPEGGLDNTELLNAARAIASGDGTMAEWEYSIRKNAENVEGTPAWRDRTKEISAGGEADVTRSNLRQYIQDQWRAWVGPYDVPQNYAESWSNWLFMNKKSEADLEADLKAISMNRWANKPEETTWDAWAAPWKSEIGSLLEVGEVADDDALLNDILSKGLTGNDALVTIRNDKRFKQTNRFLEELSSSVSDLGKQFGFIA